VALIQTRAVLAYTSGEQRDGATVISTKYGLSARSWAVAASVSAVSARSDWPAHGKAGYERAQTAGNRLGRRNLRRRDEWRAEHPRVERFRRRLRWLLLGDWHPLLRDPLDLLRLSFAVSSVAFLLTAIRPSQGICSSTS